MKKLIKKLVIVMTVASMGIGASSIWAKTGSEEKVVSYGDLQVKIKGEKVGSSNETEPFNMNGHTYVAVEDVAKALNLQVTEEAGGKVIHLQEGTAEKTGQGLTREQEDNGSYNSANELKLNATISGTVGEKGDGKDWYKFSVAQDSKVTLEFVSQGACIQANLMDSTGKKCLKWVQASDSGKGVIEKGLQKGEYYLKVVNLSAGGKVANYSIKNTVTPNQMPNDEETNDSFQEAQNYQLKQTVQGHLGYCDDLMKYDDRDWYKVVVPKKMKVNFTLVTDKNLSCSINLYKENASSVIAKDYAGKKVGQVSKELEAGTYYIAIIRNNEWGSYTLSSK